MDKSTHYGKCVILGCNRPATVRNFACLHGPWMLKPAHIEQFKSGVTLKICAGHYNEDLRLYPRDKTPKSDHPPYPVTEEEKLDYWAKVAAFGSSTASAPIRATAPKPSAPSRGSSFTRKKSSVNKWNDEDFDDDDDDDEDYDEDYDEGQMEKKTAGKQTRHTKGHPSAAIRGAIITAPADAAMLNNIVLYSGGAAPADLTQDVWENLLRIAVVEEDSELDHEIPLPKLHEPHGHPSQTTKAAAAAYLTRPKVKTHRKNEPQKQNDREDEMSTLETEEFIAAKLGKRKRPHLALELSKLHAKRRRVHTEKDTISAAPESRPSDKFVPNITLTFNLSNDPCMKYSLGIVADKDYECGSYTSFRLRREVIYVETDKERYELSWTGSRPATLPTTPVGAFTTRKDVMLDTYRWARVLNPRQLDVTAMSLLQVPLPNDCVEELELDLDWSEIEWGQNTIRVRGNEYSLRSIQFVKTHRPSSTEPVSRFEEEEEEEEQQQRQQHGYFERFDFTPDQFQFVA